MADARRRFALACASGGAVALAVFLEFLSTNSHGFFGTTPYGLGGFYDAQARALFHGHWNASSDSFFVERFNIGGKFYTYFGPWPSLLRMPLLSVTSRLDGKLTPSSLLLACITLFGAVGCVLWQVRSLRGGNAPPSRREQVGIAAFMILLGCGSTVVFLASSAWVYDEAILWGCAWAVWSLYFAVGYLRAPSRTRLILAAVTSSLSILSRQSSGVVGVIVLGSLFVVQLLGTRSQPRLRRLGQRLGKLSGIDRPLTARRPWATGLAAVTPLAAFAYVNWARFGTLLGTPFQTQDLILRTGPARAAVLRQNGNSLVSIREVPTNLLAYFRPDGFTIRGLFPFIYLGRNPTLIGNVARDTKALTASVTATATLLLALTVVGLAIVFVSRFGARSNLDRMRVLRLPALAAAISFVPTLMFPAVAERYTADLTPLLVLMGGVGLYAMAAFLRSNAGRRRLVLTVAAMLMTFNVAANLALTVNFEQSFDSAAARGSYVRDQITWTKRLGLQPSADVIDWNARSTTKRPAVGPDGSFLAVNNCAQLMESDGQDWLADALENPRATCEALKH
jgi:hypothetical protein